MKNDNSSVRFQAVVVCSRAVEQIQKIVEKLAMMRIKKTESDIPEEFDFIDYKFYTKNLNESAPDNNLIYVNELLFSEKLLETIETLLQDTNNKVRLAAAITIFTIFRKFLKPLVENYQLLKNKAESILRLSMESFSLGDKFASSQCLAMDGYNEKKVIEILLINYFKSKDQVTKEQVTFSLAHLSTHSVKKNY